ncbi:MAG TPA: peptidoglycan-binding protein [Terriglobales bacterium]|jgi:peptidoglycan hydrolase-like protein with peptidoglycan-binding domain|nr:peptidoglycan-binding protein [Terriglobales bacterium]
MVTHSEAKRIVDGLGLLTPQESFVLRAVASHETDYGAGWKPPGVGSNNWGAVTVHPNSDGSCPVGSFGYGDSKRSGAGGEGGEVEQYQTCFRIYPTPTDGAKGLLYELFTRRPSVRLAVPQGLEAVARAMRDTSYYLGTKPTKEEQIADYRQALEENGKKILLATGEDWPWSSGPFPQEPPTRPDGSRLPLPSPQPVTGSAAVALPELRLGSVGNAVSLFFQEPRSIFMTRELVERVKVFQRRLGLQADGIVGSQTWAQRIKGEFP